MDAGVTQRVTFSYQLSDWTLARVAVSMDTIQGDLPGPAPVTSPQPPSQALSAGSWGHVLRALPIIEPLPAVQRVGGFIRYVPLQYRHCFIDMSGNFDGYRRKFSSKTRSTIARKVKRYTEHCGGQLQWRAYRTPQELDAFFPPAAVVSAKSYQERLLDAGLPTAPSWRGHMREEAAQDRVRSWVLFHGDRPVSYLFCPVREDGVIVYAYLGYDPEYAKFSVGTVLQWLALEQLFDEGCFKYFDFTEGESEHKRLFATHDQLRANVMFIRDNVRARLLVRSHRAMVVFAEALGSLLQRWGLKARVKRLMRFGTRAAANST